MPGIADDQRVRACASPREPRRLPLGLGDASSAAARPTRCGAAVPDRRVLLAHLDARAAQGRDRPARCADRRDRTSRSRGRASAGLAEDFVDEPRGAVALARALLVMARDQLADQPEREQLDADDDEQDAERSSGRCPIAWPANFSDGQVAEDRSPSG